MTWIAWISKVIWTLSLTTRPPPVHRSMPNSPRLTRAVAEIPTCRSPCGPEPNPVTVTASCTLRVHAVQRQLTVDDPALVGPANAGGAVTRARVLGDIEEVSVRMCWSRFSLPVSRDARSMVALTDESSGSSPVTMVMS